MQVSSRPFLPRLSLPLALSLSVFTAACSSTSTPAPTASSAREAAGREYFAESEYGVKASPRVTSQRTRLPRGGGRDMVGKPYKVRGKWYTPKEEKNYAKVGGASWYGDAFHGRLTANGEVYDMTHLTAAHPTMPLPSYARVTNTKNGASVVVRVNDRGPFANGRIIDLSKRAAEMLDYKHAGVAKVKVEYMGRAPLHGRDDNYLLASYRPGSSGLGRPRPVDDGLPTGVMIAMNGSTPTTQRRSLFSRLGGTQPAQQQPAVSRPLAAPVAAAGASAIASAAQPAAPAFEDFPEPLQGEVLASDPVLPDLGPALPDRPYDGFGTLPLVVADASLSYADRRIGQAAQALEAAVGPALDEAAIRSSWKRQNGTTPPSPEYVAAGTYAGKAEAERLAAALRAVGKVAVVAEDDAYVVELRPDGRFDLDRMVGMARDAGAAEAFLVRE